MTEDFHGVFPYLVSPIDEQGSVKRDVLSELVSWLIEQGIHGLSPLGSTGEVHYTTERQREEIVATVIETAKSRVPVLPGVFGFSVQQAIRQGEAYLAAGADGIILMLQEYFPLSKEEIVRYFRTVARSLDCPVVLYTNPKLGTADLTPEIVQALCDTENIRYLKDATGNTGRLLTLKGLVGDRIKIFSASAHIPLAVMGLGGVGWMAGPACLLPAESARLYELARQEKWPEAIALQERLWSINAAFQRYPLAACIKAGLHILGFDVGPPLPPLRALDQEEAEAVRRAILQGKGASEAQGPIIT